MLSHPEWPSGRRGLQAGEEEEGGVGGGGEKEEEEEDGGGAKTGRRQDQLTVFTHCSIAKRSKVSTWIVGVGHGGADGVALQGEGGWRGHTCGNEEGDSQSERSVS